MDILTIIYIIVGVVATALGIITGIDYVYKEYRKRLPKKISWHKVETGVLALIKNMRQDNFVPDIVVGLGRSGAIFGGLLAGNMKNLPFTSIDRCFQWDKKLKRTVQSNPTHIKHKSFDNNCKKILIVIGEIYSAQSISEAVEALKPQLKDKEYRTACLVQNRTSPFIADYYAFLVNEPKRPPWVITNEYIRFTNDRHPKI